MPENGVFHSFIHSCPKKIRMEVQFVYGIRYENTIYIKSHFSSSKRKKWYIFLRWITIILTSIMPEKIIIHLQNANYHEVINENEKTHKLTGISIVVDVILHNGALCWTQRAQFFLALDQLNFPRWNFWVIITCRTWCWSHIYLFLSVYVCVVLIEFPRLTQPCKYYVDSHWFDLITGQNIGYPFAFFSFSVFKWFYHFIEVTFL